MGSIYLVVQWLLGCLLLLNVRAFPMVWHVRVFRPLIYIWISQSVLYIKTIFHSKPGKEKAFERWIDSLTAIGESPFRSTVYRSWASIDESDYNFHLSNSSYAKALDGARFKLVAQLLPKFIIAGGLIPLAGTHFQFLREIPILAKYEVRITLGAWDEKWVYIVCRFVSQGNNKPKKNGPQADISPSFFHAPISSSGVSMTSTPLNHTVPVPPTDIDKLAAKIFAKEEPDGATLHTITISQMCFKVGRITVPPAVVFAANGLSVPPDFTPESEMNSTNLEKYSHANPPPHWNNVNKIASKLHGGSIQKLRAFFRGGWKDVPEGERWWEQAMGGVVEEQRQRNLDTLDLLRKGMEGARAMR